MLFIVLVVLALALFYYLTQVHEGLSLGPWKWPKKGLSGWSWFWRDSLYPYHNDNLTVKPIGSPGTENVYRHWKNREKHWKVEYGDDRINTDMNRVTGLVDTSLSQRPISGITDIHPDYYHNPIDYCKAHPDARPCPNFWRAKRRGSSSFKGIDGKFTHASGDMSKPVPKMKIGVPPAVKDTQINDNYHTRVLKPDRYTQCRVTKKRMVQCSH